MGASPNGNNSLFCHKTAQPQEEAGWTHARDPFARLKNCMKELWRNDMRREGTWTLAAPFPCGSGDSDRGLFSHTGVWVGAVSLSAVNTRLALSRGWGLKHILRFFLIFPYIFSFFSLSHFLTDKWLISWGWPWSCTSATWTSLMWISIYTEKKKEKKNRISFCPQQHYKD